jgi:hypothetical protein
MRRSTAPLSPYEWRRCTSSPASSAADASAGLVPWLIAILGAVGAAALFVQVVSDNTLPGRGQAYRADQDLAPLIVAAAITLLIPAIAAIARPRLFGVSLLAGLIAGGASGVVYYTGFASLFALTLLGLLTLVAPLSRSGPDA